MCGIAGILNRAPQAPPTESAMRSMLGAIRHRGPDEFGILLDSTCALGSARLSIVDLAGGGQPIANEDESLWIVYNGEVFNFPELRAGLEQRGHRFRTRTDTEVVLHLFEELGPRCLDQLNGQFAFAIWNSRNRELFLARDRLGVRPLFYTEQQGRLLFGSEVKVLLTQEGVHARPDLQALEEIFVHWSVASDRTVFEGVRELPAGSFLIANERGVRIERWWEVRFPDSSIGDASKDEAAWAGQLEETLQRATEIRLRADVTVGAYLSGGLDSSILSALVHQIHSGQLRTFSIAFENPEFDERHYQTAMARALGTDHVALEMRNEDIAQVFPDVIWHCETPLMRTSPAPLFLLSRAVRQSGLKVVLTGEGADEFFGGYDLFKEDRIRRFWARQPNSKWRWKLFQRLYADIPAFSKVAPAFLAQFYREGLSDTDLPSYSHAVRWRNNRRNRRFFHAEVLDRLHGVHARTMQDWSLPCGFDRWGSLEKAQYWEISLFLSRYLLSSQGDRVSMAHSVEGRFPFLDREVLALSAQLPSSMKLRGLCEKYILRKTFQSRLPALIANRPKKPYRAPIHRSFFYPGAPDYVREALSPEALRSTGLFEPEFVAQLLARVELGKAMGETDDMALAGILSTQLWYQRFCHRFVAPDPLRADERVQVVRLCA